MTLVGFIAALAHLIGLRVAFSERTPARIGVFFVLLLIHLAATYAYYQFALATRIDAYAYYVDAGAVIDYAGFGFTSTHLIYSILYYGQETVGGTFLDWSIAFSLTSFAGICLLLRAVDEVFREFETDPPLYAYLPLFLPGIHFWTSAIGKDGPLFLGACLAIWASMHLRTRWKAMAVAMLFMIFFRPHIGLIAALSLGAMLLFYSRIRLSLRIPFIIGAAMVTALAASTASATLGLDLTSGRSISEFLIKLGEVTASTDVAGNSAVYGSFGVKLFSLLFRPLFFDAEDFTYIVASMENSVIILIFGTMVFKFRQIMSLFGNVPYIRFCMIFGIAVCCALALVYYNIGLGLRQRTMFIPALLIIYISLIALGYGRRSLESNRIYPNAEYLKHA